MVMTDKRTLAAGGSTTNVLQDKIAERLLEDSIIRLYVNSDKDLVTARLIIGDSAAVDDEEVSDRGAAIERDKDLLSEELGLAGDKVILRYTNANAAAAVIRTMVALEPVG